MAELTTAQSVALKSLCEGYRVEFDPAKFSPQFDLPAGWVAGWVGPIYVGCSPKGDVTS